MGEARDTYGAKEKCKSNFVGELWRKETIWEH